MTRYKHAELEDDASSVGSVQLGEGVSSTTTHIRYHPVSARSAKRDKTSNFVRQCAVPRTFRAKL